MIDCYMALNVPYTIKLIKALKPYNVYWVEEFLPPDDYEGYEEVKVIRFRSRGFVFGYRH